MRVLLRIAFLSSMSLFGGLCFAAAPISSLNVNNENAQAQAAAAPQNSMTPQQQIARLENQVQYLSTYTTQLQNLSTQMDVLRGQMEGLKYQVKLLQNQVTGLNKAVQAAQTPVVPAATTPAIDNTSAPTTMATSNNTAMQTVSVATATKAVAATPAVNPKEQAAFNQAYALLTAQEYDNATTAFNTFLTTYPKSTLAPDAHYWLGDLYLAEGQPDNASQQYKLVVGTQNSTKRPDAMVKLGTILLAYGDNTNAKKLFQQVQKQYPNTAAATLATARLKTITASS